MGLMIRESCSVNGYVELKDLIVRFPKSREGLMSVSPVTLAKVELKL